MTGAGQLFTTTPLAARVERLVDGVPGWSPVDQLFTLATLVYATSNLPGDIVEIGSWCGRSAIVLGTAAQETGSRVHAIDLFPRREDWHRNADGSYSFRTRNGDHEYEGYQDQTVWAVPFETQMQPVYDVAPDIFALFLENVSSHGCADVVVPHRGTSATFAASVPPDFRCRVLFIDGDHGYEASRTDFVTLTRFLVPGGWVCFDDAFSTYEGVNRTIMECVAGNQMFDVAQQMTRKCFAARKRASVERH